MKKKNLIKKLIPTEAKLIPTEAKPIKINFKQETFIEKKFKISYAN